MDEKKNVSVNHRYTEEFEYARSPYPFISF